MDISRGVRARERVSELAPKNDKFLSHATSLLMRDFPKPFVRYRERFRKKLEEEIAALKADQSISDEAKKEELTQLEAALKGVKPIAFKENIALVIKYYDKLLPLMQVLGPAD